MFFTRYFKVQSMFKLPLETSVEETITLACETLKQGKIVAVPTDTIYGIAGLAQSDKAVAKIYNLKKRDYSKPLAICVGQISDIFKYGRVHFPKSLLYDLLPGPVTIVLERQPCLNPNLNPSVHTIGIRIPKYKFIQDLAVACNEPLVLTSANLSSAASTLAVEEFQEIWPFLDLIIDGGKLGQQDPNRMGSTIIDLSKKGFYRVIRDGCYLKKTKEILHEYELQEISCSIEVNYRDLRQ